SYWVATDVSRKNSYTLAQDLNRANNLQIGKRWATQSGLTIWDDIKERTGVNFIASDVASDPSKYVDIGVFGDYIHELGNALGAETGMDDPFGDYAAENAKSSINDPDV